MFCSAQGGNLASSACATPPQDTPKRGENKTKNPHKAKPKNPLLIMTPWSPAWITQLRRADCQVIPSHTSARQHWRHRSRQCHFCATEASVTRSTRHSSGRRCTATRQWHTPGSTERHFSRWASFCSLFSLCHQVKKNGHYWPRDSLRLSEQNFN